MMTSIFLAVLFLLGFVAALHGWGRLLLAWCDRSSTAAWPYAVVVGMGLWLVAGGILNYFHLAHSPALDTLFGAGLAIWLFFAYRALRGRPVPVAIGSSLSAFSLSAYLAVVGVAAMLVVYLMPVAAFNIYDDFHTYLMRPVRMLQTGTLGGDPFDLLGMDSLGGQSFLQAFFIRWLPLDYVNGFDAVLCFTLSAFLLVVIARATGAAWLYLWLAFMVLIAINPHYVNISSLYSATAMVLAIIYSSAQLGKDVFSREANVEWARAVPVGLLLGSLVALKSPFALFAAMYFGTYVGLALLLRAYRSRAWRAVLFVAAVGSLVVLPWIGVSWPNYAAALDAPSPTAGGMLGAGDMAELFSSTELYWGNSFADYTRLVLMLMFAAAAALYLHVTAHESSRSPYLAPLFAACVAGAVAYFGNMYVFGDAQMAVRYTIPILIAVSPSALIVLGSHAPMESLLRPLRGNGQPGIAVLGVALIGVGLVTTLSFADVLIQRIKRVHTQRTLLSFPIKDAEVRFSSVAVRDVGKTWARNAQAATEAGQPILAWISVPFQLDFVRNRIFVVMEPGLINPWLKLPLGADSTVLRQYLERLGIRYVMLEHKGLGITTDAVLHNHLRSRRFLYRRLGEHNLYFRRALQSLAVESRSRVLIHNEQMVVFDLQAKAERQ